jgi:signal transduction histidine kinase
MATVLPPENELAILSPRDAWVDMQLASTFMRYALATLHSSVLVTVIVVALLYGSVDPLALGIWTLAAAAMAVLRYAVVFRFRRNFEGVSGPRLNTFLARWGWAWPASGVVWGASMFVFFLKAPAYDQFVCITVLIAMPGFAVGTLSAYLRGFNGYVDGLCLTVLAALMWELLNGQAIPANFTTVGMFVLAAVYWSAIRLSGRRFHDVQRANFELQFDNHALVSSLTAKTRSALEAVAVKNRFIASAAHDLRQPVHALSLYASWLVAEPQLVEQIAPKISRSTRAVNDMFDSLFDFAGLENAVQKPNLQMVDLTALVKDLELQYAPMALERNLDLRIRTVSGLKVRSDPLLLKRLVGNLLSNALKNTIKGGVLLAVRRRRNAVHLEVWDTGVGVAREHQHAIFQEFYRIPQPGTDEGFGLGLAIVSGLSRALGHPVGLLSRVGRGSVFWVQLPIFRTDDLSIANQAQAANTMTNQA